MSTVGKILKFELFLLFVLTSVSFLDFYYQNALPDNYLEISSQEPQLNLLVYYISSFIAFIGYYTGPWILFPFIIYSFFYTFQFSRRDKLFDTVNFFSLPLGSLFLAASFFPSMVGRGSLYLLNNWVDPWLALVLGPSLIALFFTVAFRISIKEVVRSPFVFLAGLPEKFRYLYSVLNPFHWPEMAKEAKAKLSVSLSELRIPLLSKKKPLKQTTALKLKPEKQKEESEEEKEPVENKIKKDLKQIDYHKFVNSLIARKETTKKSEQLSDQYFEEIVGKIESKLAEFKIEGSIINILKGPVINTFELELGSGVKVSKILNHETDLSLALFGVPL
ncbi:MAG: DNA translocase FtsK, partial [Halobacteriovoraceae bacterium]|nr:DNA translocase FtsK [Halobacteriovoraceae bacterium]